MSFRITVNPGNTLADLNRLSNQLKTGVKTALEAGGKSGEDKAKQVVPVRTGALRASIYHKVSNNSLEVGATQNYAAAVENLCCYQ